MLLLELEVLWYMCIIICCELIGKMSNHQFKIFISIVSALSWSQLTDMKQLISVTLKKRLTNVEQITETMDLEPSSLEKSSD